MTVRRLLAEIPAPEILEWAVMEKMWYEAAHGPPKTTDEQIADLLKQKASAKLAAREIDARGTTIHG